ncbi:glycosyltransferase [Hirschia litorea]|uniref:Glycosyltransferase n=1 Tax=Hirschia litorea TaxID=1199156 RepID=A0ABW2IPU5_9PROT
MLISEIYLWGREYNPHLVPIVDALSKNRGVGKVVYIVESMMPESRISQGLSSSFPENYLESLSDGQVENVIKNSSPDSIHIFAGLRRVPCIVLGIKLASKYKRMFGIIQEPRVLEGISGKIRLAQSILNEGNIRKKARFILAIGEHGPRWFKLAGYNSELIFPFAYFLEPSTLQVREKTNLKVRVGFVGRLEVLKGFDLFLSAAECLDANYEIHIAGKGSLGSEIEQYKNPSSSNIHFHGVVPSNMMGDFMSSIDILVLPSITTDDGWGAVVSEALFQGCYPVVSNRVGASMMLRDPNNGAVIPWGDTESIVQSIKLANEKGYLSSQNRKQREQWARDVLSAEFGAAYLLEIFSNCFGNAPKPIWF